MRCPVHCPPARSVLPRAVAVLVMAALSSAAYAAVASVAEAVALAVLGSCVPASWVTWRMVAHGSLRKPRAVPVRRPAARYASGLVNELNVVNEPAASLTYAARALPAAPLATAAPPLTVVTTLAKVVTTRETGARK